MLQGEHSRVWLFREKWRWRELGREGLVFSHCRRVAPNNVSAVLNRRIHWVHPVPIKNVVPDERNVLWHI